jgi:hypothetical protein
MIRLQRRKLNMLERNEQADAGFRPEDYERWREVSRQLRAIQRAAILNLRNHQRISDDVMRKLEYEIDLVDAGSASSDRT